MLKEIDYPVLLIKRATSYLNGITYEKYHIKKGYYQKKISNRERAYAWYYVYNNGNKTDAYTRAYYSNYHNSIQTLVPVKDVNYNTVNAGGFRLYKKGYIKQAIKLIRDDIEDKLRTDLPMTLLQQLQTQATYDPAMFVNPDGSPAFTDWDEIPIQYRCCVAGIKTKHYGQFSEKEYTEIELVPHATARKEILTLVPGLLVADAAQEQMRLVGNSDSLKISYKGKSDEDLLKIIDRSEKKK